MAERLETFKSVLDGGYVRLVTYTPWNMVDLHNAVVDQQEYRIAGYLDNHDLSAVNAARASFAKEKGTMEEADERLIRFLAKAAPVIHGSPFRHAHVTLEINAPLAICRQWWRHVVGGGTTEEGLNWSELSRRYVRGEIEVHVPTQFRLAAANAKQGSAGPLPPSMNANCREAFAKSVDVALLTYDMLVENGVAPEQARMVLPQSTYTTFRWSPSIQALAQFLVQREDSHAQEEIRVYAAAVRELVLPIFPHSIRALAPEVSGNANPSI